jgi:hypothetical protein
MCSHEVPKAFSTGFQDVPQVLDVFFEMFSTTPHFFNLVLFGDGSTSMYITCKGRGNWGVAKAGTRDAVREGQRKA